MSVLKKLEVKPGKKLDTELNIPGMQTPVPITVIKGNNPGETVLVQAGLHNAEFPGIQAAIELRNEIRPEDINGTLIIIPLLNAGGFYNRTMSVLNEDKGNLNRVFPGSPDGSPSEQAAFFLVNELYKDLDAFIDLHSGDCYENLNEFVYAQGKADPETAAKSLKMAQATDTPFIVSSKSDSGGAYNYAARMGVPAVLIERGSKGVWNTEEVQKDKKDVLNILKTLGVYKGEPKTLPLKEIFGQSVYAACKTPGCWYPAVQVEEGFYKGDKLGEVRDLSGRVLQEVRAEGDGFVLYRLESLNALENDTLVAYALDCPQKGV